MKKRNYHAPIPHGVASKMLTEFVQSPPAMQQSMFTTLTIQDVIPERELSIMSLKAVVDKDMIEQVPDMLPCLPSRAYPIVVSGDGNCLARCGTLLAYGSEEFHLDIRLRLVKELVENEDLSLSNAYLSRGLTSTPN